MHLAPPAHDQLGQLRAGADGTAPRRRRRERPAPRRAGPARAPSRPSAPAPPPRGTGSSSPQSIALSTCGRLNDKRRDARRRPRAAAPTGSCGLPRQDRLLNIGAHARRLDADVAADIVRKIVDHDAGAAQLRCSASSSSASCAVIDPGRTAADAAVASAVKPSHCARTWPRCAPWPRPPRPRRPAPAPARAGPTGSASCLWRNMPAVSRSRAGEASSMSLRDPMAEPVARARGKLRPQRERQQAQQPRGQRRRTGKFSNKPKNASWTRVLAVLQRPLQRTADRSAARRRPGSA